MYSHIISILRSILQTEEIIESNKCTVYGKQSEKKSRLFCKVSLVHFKQQKTYIKTACYECLC